jgi:hypothetical protein
MDSKPRFLPPEAIFNDGHAEFSAAFAANAKF